MLEKPLVRLDGPNGETVITVACNTCRLRGEGAPQPQVRWDRVSAMLDEMEAAGEHRRQISPS